MRRYARPKTIIDLARAQRRFREKMYARPGIDTRSNVKDTGIANRGAQPTNSAACLAPDKYRPGAGAQHDEKGENEQ